jgi:hypothetical protein
MYDLDAIFNPDDPNGGCEVTSGDGPGGSRYEPLHASSLQIAKEGNEEKMLTTKMIFLLSLRSPPGFPNTGPGCREASRPPRMFPAVSGTRCCWCRAASTALPIGPPPLVPAGKRYLPGKRTGKSCTRGLGAARTPHTNQYQPYGDGTRPSSRWWRILPFPSPRNPSGKSRADGS